MISPEARKYLVLIGCTFLVMPVCVHLTFGNLLSYLLSYYNDRAPAIVEWINPLWTTTAFMVAHSLGILLSSVFENYLFPRIAMIFGVVLISASVLLTYYTVVQPLGLVLVFGAFQGLGGGFVTALVVRILTETMPEDTELAFTVAWLGPGFYAMIQILLAHYLINPTNHPPEVAVHNSRHFIKPAILDNVPCYFLKIGLITLLIELTGFVLIQFECNEKTSQTKNLPETINTTAETSQQDDAQNQHTIHGAEASGQSMNETNREVRNMLETTFTADCWRTGEGTTSGAQSLNGASAIPGPKSATDPKRDSVKNSNERTSLVQSGSSTYGKDNTSSADPTEPNKDLSPQETLSRAQFWKLWLMTAMMGHAFFIHINLYKQHGLTQIHRDKLLTICGVIGLAIMITCRPLTSVLTSKIGLKFLLLILCAASNILMTLLPITLTHIHVLYALCVIAQFCVILSLFLLINMVPLIFFGLRFYPMNLGLLNTALIFIYVVDSGLTPVLIHHAGWNILYISGTFTSTIGFFLCLTIPWKDLQFP